VVDGICQTGLDALIALTAITAVQTAGRFGLAFGLLVAQLNFVEVALALFYGQLRHPGPGRAGFLFGNRPVTGVFIDDRFATRSQVPPFNVTQDGLGGFLAGADRSDGNPWAGL